MKKIAVIGAGLSGLVLAYSLKKDAEIHIFEKSRGVGGRMSTRYAEPFQFDHGAQYFTARSDEFKTFLIPYIAKGVVKEWNAPHQTIPSFEKEGADETIYVGAPRMTELARSLAEHLNITIQTEITAIKTLQHGWMLETKNGRIDHIYDWVTMTAPAAQCQKLMPTAFSGHPALSPVHMTGCYSLMMGFEKPLSLDWDRLRVKNSLISWIAVNSSKPGRETGYSLLAQSTNEWADNHINDDMNAAQSMLFKEVISILPEINIDPVHIDTHRWRYAATSVPAGHDYLIDETHHLAVCGDWCLRGTVESAFLSGNRLAGKIRETLA